VAGDRGGFWIAAASAILHPACYVIADRRNSGEDRIPIDGGAILVLNHISHLDPVYDAVFVHQQHRIPHFLAKHSLFEPPLMKQVMNGTGQIPVYRGTVDAKDSLRDAHAALREGKVVLIYPEGTVTKDPLGWPMRSRTGVARLALEHDVPVLPAARWGTREILNFYDKKFRPLPRRTVATAVGEPVDLAEYRNKPVTNETLRAVTDLLMWRVTELLAGIRGETAPEQFYVPPAAGKPEK
jgi:1-acyl-sn-glycerol-3-phosphate acyltransferase